MKEAASTTRLFGQNVFNDAVMCERLPKKMYDELKKSLDRGEELSPAVAEAIAGRCGTGQSSAAQRIIRTGFSR